MADKYAWIKTWLPVGVLLVGVVISYTKLQSNVDTVKTDNTDIKVEAKRLDTCKVEKETFTEYKDRREKEFQEFKDNQKDIKDKLHNIELSNADIKAKLELIIKAVNNK